MKAICAISLVLGLVGGDGTLGVTLTGAPRSRPGSAEVPAAAASSPVEDQRGPVDYKRHLADELTRRVLRRALDRVGATAPAA